MIVIAFSGFGPFKADFSPFQRWRRTIMITTKRTKINPPAPAEIAIAMFVLAPPAVPELSTVGLFVDKEVEAACAEVVVFSDS